MAQYMMAFDAGTTSSRCILFDRNGKICSLAQREFTQFFPTPGWVEHDALEIWDTQLAVAKEAMEKLNVTYEDIAAIGITNQRETSFGRTGARRNSAISWWKKGLPSLTGQRRASL